jgi:sugar O-acyltransferase (sialic acid O-acetyltransferase NeuD family)
MRTTASDDPVFIYGASGHGKVVSDILHACGQQVAGFIDDNPNKIDTTLDLKVAGDGNWLAEQALQRPITVALGVGDNVARRIVAERCITTGIRLLTVVHPSATVSTSAAISSGVVIMPHAVVNACSVIGTGVIINTAAIVEHDCHIGNFAHLSPKVAIGGNVLIGDLSWLGIGSTVIPGIRIGTGSVVGAGATVVRDIDSWVVAVGTPARVTKELAHQI